MPAPRFDPAAIEGLLTETLGDWKRISLATPRRGPDGAPVPLVRAGYTRGDQQAQIAVTAERSPGQRDVHRARRASGEAVVTVTLANGLAFAASGAVPEDALEGLLNRIDLARAEALAPRRR